jgi:PAS domain S-box-containing protein
MERTASQIPESGAEKRPVDEPTLALLAGLSELHHALYTASSEGQILAAVARHLDRWPASSGAGDAVAEMLALHGLTDQLNATTTLDELLSAIAAQPFAEGAHFVVLSTIEVDKAGSPEWMTHVAVVAEPALAAKIRGMRTHVPSYPSAQLWVKSPGAAFISPNAQLDPTSDDTARAWFIESGVKGLVFLPLVVRDRWVGVLMLGWLSERPFSRLDHRTYNALGRKIALIVDYRLLLARAEEGLRKAQRWRIEQETIFDNMTIGVLLADAATGDGIRINKRFRSLLQLEDERVGDLQHSERRTLEPGTDIDVPRSEWPLQRTMATGARAEAEYDLLRPDGSRVTVHVVATPVRDENGVVTKCLVLLTDITDRRRAERERLRMQEDLIQAQAEALAERGNPLIPISKEIVVMPVIGSIDVARGQEMLSALLEGASRARAKFAILDITGARRVDTQAASALIGAAKALRLLGVEPVLTGVRPEIAQTLVSLGLGFDDIVTRGTLESGIAYASQRL